jgi:hypothetical protein
MADSRTSDPFSFQLAPERLWQAINPLSLMASAGQFGLINISLGDTRHPDVERTLLAEVGSYGRQLGHIGEALEVLIDHFDHNDLSRKERDALAILKGELAEIRTVKARELGRD